jgi:hypothetical protein
MARIQSNQVRIARGYSSTNKIRANLARIVRMKMRKNKRNRILKERKNSKMKTRIEISRKISKDKDRGYRKILGQTFLEEASVIDCFSD